MRQVSARVPPSIPLIAVLALSLAACAATRPVLDVRGADERLTAAQAAAAPDSVLGRRVHWGGVLVSSVNLSESTRLEVLSYPLDRRGRPETAGAPLGRFYAEREGYLETAVYVPGRLLTVVGAVTEVRSGKVGEMPYEYPVVEVEQVHLWPREERPREPRLRFGIGVML
jgi:outer membrane lipoprotein